MAVEVRKWSKGLREWVDDVVDLIRPSRSRIENTMKVMTLTVILAFVAVVFALWLYRAQGF